MRARPTLVLAVGLTGCWDLPPSSAPLTAEAEDVEILTETPNLDIYESFGDVTADAIGKGSEEAASIARHILRNRAAAMHARFVSVDDAIASFAWDFSGRTIITLRGRAFRVKEETPPVRVR
jgi:hypothetical protein